MQNPSVHSGNTTWAPSGVVAKDNTLYFGGLRGEAVYSLDITSRITLDFREEDRLVKEHFKGQLSRIRGVILDPGQI